MITYRETHTYKYILEKNYHIQLPGAFSFGHSIDSEFISLENGELVIGKGYRWDGPSGPTVDTKNFMRGSLVHDVLYQLLREGYLNQKYRKDADKLLVLHCKEDGMSYFRRQMVYFGLRIGGKSSAKPQKKHEIETAP